MKNDAFELPESLYEFAHIAASFPSTQGKKKDKRKRVFLFGTQSA